ncbi:restriction endonuclease subunit S [Endozoicomonas euniceicola]|uniref:Restriction endonuclease subunit S n=1 Tax=Endozoicomonas euniceicola TaxID=1234143 RepID=A0ABY6GML4_9GAMM|nr:restriction endonuclease subunit S [Endozoicomonas euniceicola]UYM13960.1 restriction endonuclease subunit S [Endozoicomonas euniceicola]
MQDGDLVIAMDRTWVSNGLKVSQVNKADLPCYLVQRVSRLRTKDSFSQSLLKHLFSSYRFEQYVKGVQTDSVVPHISSKQIQEFLIAAPPIKEQQEIAKILSTTDRKLNHLTTQKSQTQQLKKGLMQKLLTGQIRVKPEPQDH